MGRVGGLVVGTGLHLAVQAQGTRCTSVNSSKAKATLWKPRLLGGLCGVMLSGGVQMEVSFGLMPKDP